MGRPKMNRRKNHLQSLESIVNQENSMPSLLLNKDQPALRKCREFSLTPVDDVIIVCGEKCDLLNGEKQFICRLLSLEGLPAKVKCVEFSRESFECLMTYEAQIRRLLITGMKALVFQNCDIQVYVMKENEMDGYMVHFEDRQRRKISLHLDVFEKFVIYKYQIEDWFAINEEENNISCMPSLSLNKDQPALRKWREFSLTAVDNVSIVCGEKYDLLYGDKQFVCRLLSLEELPAKVKYVEFSRESFECLMMYEAQIRRLLVSKMKALVFQNGDIQVYVMMENKMDGYMVHFEDRERTKISLHIDAFEKLLIYKNQIYHWFAMWNKCKD